MRNMKKDKIFAVIDQGILKLVYIILYIRHVCNCIYMCMYVFSYFIAIDEFV